MYYAFLCEFGYQFTNNNYIYLKGTAWCFGVYLHGKLLSQAINKSVTINTLFSGNTENLA
jgi:hypothetical protein